MKLPRNVSAGDLIKALGAYGYSVTRQKGSHIRLSTQQKGEHHVTVPNHNPLRVGTLFSILRDVADHLRTISGTPEMIWPRNSSETDHDLPSRHGQQRPSTRRRPERPACQDGRQAVRVATDACPFVGYNEAKGVASKRNHAQRETEP